MSCWGGQESIGVELPGLVTSTTLLKLFMFVDVIIALLRSLRQSSTINWELLPGAAEFPGLLMWVLTKLYRHLSTSISENL